MSFCFFGRSLIADQVIRLLSDCDGAIVMSPLAIEAEAIKVLKQWFAETNRPLYAIGPLLPLKHYKDGHNELVTGGSDNGKDALAFLDDMLAKHGKKSLVYVSGALTLYFLLFTHGVGRYHLGRYIGLRNLKQFISL